jgi:hypothetical protein
MTTDNMISMISMIPPPVLSESIFPPTEGDGDLDLSCILGEIFPDLPDIEFETTIADRVQSNCTELEKSPDTTSELPFMAAMASTSTTPYNAIVSCQVSDCSLVSDDEMSQNNLSKSPSQSSMMAERADDIDDDVSIPDIKTTTLKAVVPQPVVSTYSNVVVTTTSAAPASKKRSASEMIKVDESSNDDLSFPGETKQKVQRR